MWGIEHGVAFLDTVALFKKVNCSLIDIGAHHGTVTRAALHANCQVWSFETDSRSQKQLHHNVPAMRIYTSEHVDNVVPENIFATMVKIDVDGADYKLARRANNTLRRALSVHVEIRPRGRNAIDAYLRFLRDAGFRLFVHWCNPLSGVCPRGVPSIRDEKIEQLRPQHPARALVRSCGLGFVPLNTSTVDALFREGTYELDIWGVRHEACG